MNRVRMKFDPPFGLTGSPNTTKPNRLRRSFRQTQRTQTAAEVDSPKSQQPVFKTPTRIPRSRAGGGFSGESPHNDSDFQQDIIWDATSPSPNRLGKRGKKHPVGVVDISEIVSRIAPEHGRPRVAEPTLQQWIGDSATIPCTPDVQVPKPKKKSPRPNGVDDLLKLAKQFDFNMFHQDDEEEEEEKEVEDPHQQSLELLSGDILDLENGDQNIFSPPHPGSCRPAVTAAAGTDEQVHLDQHVEDDLDFLFDGPTQHVSGDLSQVSSAQLSQVKPASGKPSSSSCAPTSGVSTTNAKGALANDEFEDDWENDDLLNDSLVLEMTQNPQNFTAPKHCSTQKPSGPVNAPALGGAGHDQSAVSKVEKDNVRQRTTFRLDPNPNFSVTRIQTDTWTNSKVDYSSKGDAHQSRCSSGKSSLVEAGSQRTWQTSNTARLRDPQKPEFHQRTSAASFKYNTTDTKTAQSFQQKPEAGSSRSEVPAVFDLLDEDLDAFFSADPVWDDPADDDLLCEMCEDVENQIQSVVSTKQTLPVSNQRAALQPSSRTGGDNRTQQPANRQPFPQKQTPVPCDPGRPAGASLAAGFVSNVAAGAQTNTNSFRFTQAKNTPGPTNSSGCLQGSSRVQPAPQGSSRVQPAPQGSSRVQPAPQGSSRVQPAPQGSSRVRPAPQWSSRVRPAPQGSLRNDQFTFKKPGNPVSTVSSKVPGKCSAAEIELKKQQAMEKRRQRLQAAQNLRAPT